LEFDDWRRSAAFRPMFPFGVSSLCFVVVSMRTQKKPEPLACGPDFS
jgi:hypothetical protein